MLHAQTAQLQHHANAAPRRASDTRPPSSGIRSKPAVLIVEADDALRRKLARRLSRSGMFVRTAKTLGEAIAALEHSCIAALVMELELPDGCALPVLQKARERRVGMPVLVISATANVLAVSRACQLSASFVSKHSDGKDLWSSVDLLVAQVQHHEDMRSGLVRRLSRRGRLTPAEAETLDLFAQLGARDQLAGQLGIAETSVRSRVRGVCRKLNITRLQDVFRLLLDEALPA